MHVTCMLVTVHAICRALQFVKSPPINFYSSPVEINNKGHKTTIGINNVSKCSWWSSTVLMTWYWFWYHQKCPLLQLNVTEVRDIWWASLMSFAIIVWGFLYLSFKIPKYVDISHSSDRILLLLVTLLFVNIDSNT